MTDSNYQDPARRTETGPHTTILAFESRAEQTADQLSCESSYANLQYLFDAQNPTMLAPKSNRSRRKSNQGSEQTKHRRTRSGCYTCRSRRVKCDETHPICERCKKGGRECVFPEISPSSSSKVTYSGPLKSGQLAAHESPDSSSDEYEDEVVPERLKSIPDEDKNFEVVEQRRSMPRSGANRNDNSQSFVGQKSTTRNSSETPSLVQDKGASPTPSTEGSVGCPAYQTSRKSRLTKPGPPSTGRSDNLRNDWSHLPQDLKFYLEYFYDNLTYLHYSLKYDSENFLRTLFLDAALRNEALLYAVVGFAAFQRTLHNPRGKIQDFLQYYNKAVSLLLKSLMKGERHGTGTLLAILQLATIEEFLGDWINLLGHQKAAYEILTELYTPQAVMQTEMTRVILGWYMRFDVFAGLMGGFETVLSREWFSRAQEFFHAEIRRESQILKWKLELSIAQLRLIAMDMSTLFAKKGKGEITRNQFVSENEAIGRRIEEWKTKMDPALQDSRYLVTDFSDARALDPEDIVNPYLPGVLYSGPLWVMNVTTIDWYAIDLMHKYKTALTMQTRPSAELGFKAYASCQLFEAVEFWPKSPPGAMLACQASLGIACLFLPRDERHSMWARRKLATIESHGYIYPYTFRSKMSDLFGDRSCMNWWLPNNEDYPPIIRSIRKFVEERTSPATDVSTEDLRDMKAIFSSMNLDDGKSSLPQDASKKVVPATSVAVAPAHEWRALDLPQEELGHLNGIDDGVDGVFGLSFDDEQGWSTGGVAFGMPKPGALL